MIFSAPLSPLTHNVFARAPARSWLATGECGRVYFLANTTPETDWRYGVLQAVHELVEAAIHRHNGVSQDDIDTADFDALAEDRPAPTRAHMVASSLETQLALALGVSTADYARVTRGIRPQPIGADIRQHP
jgi:hypothetical protein